MDDRSIVDTMTKPRKLDTLDFDAMVNSILNWHALATDAQLASGVSWYPDALQWATALADRTGYTVVQVAAVMAAFSPQTRWADNLRDAENLLRDLPKRSGVMGDNMIRARMKTCFGSPA